MDVATGAMGSLLLKLGKLLKGGYKLQNSVKRDIEFLEKELRSMQPALRKLAELKREQLDELAGFWANEMKELSYEMEDVIDTFLEHIEGFEHAANADGFKGIMKKMSNLVRKGKTHRLIANAIRDLKDQIQEMANRRERYRVNDVVAHPVATTIIDPRMVVLYKDHKGFVGIGDASNELTKRLAEEGDDVKIHSIFGFKGLGKTTLALVVYDRLQKQFECGAFVSVSQNPIMKYVLRDILRQLDKHCYMGLDSAAMDERQLIDEIRELLQKKRYIIVIDDIWDIKAWQIIKCALIDNDLGSRIIITTRIFEVAKKIGSVYKLQKLSRHNSEELFRTRLFGGKGKGPNDQQAEIPESLLQKCGGVPLAIISTASLLACKPMEYWSEVYTSTGFGLGYNQDDKNTGNILFSYYDLPFHLRTFFLYLSIFPEDYVIRKDTLIWKWVAEGFVHEEQGKGLFEVGARYFNELINRGLIQPVETPHQGITIGCRVHVWVLDVIYSLSVEENFLTILDSSEQHTSSQSNVRRLAIQKKVIEQYDSLPNTRAPQVRSFNPTMCHFSMMPSLSSFQVLRVLAFEDCTFVEGHLYHLSHLGRLIQLRYLGLRSTPIHELPEEIGHLRFLQTLDLRQTKVQELPSSIGLLKQLKCLRADGGSIRVPDWIGNLTSLEELSLNDVSNSPNFLEGLGKMRELRELRIKRCDENSNKALVESLRNLQKIQVLVLGDGLTSMELNWEGYVPPRQFRQLIMRTKLSALPVWINSLLLPNLSCLYLTLSKAMEAQDVDTLGRLPELLSLSLLMPANVFPAVTVGGAFPKLRYFVTSAPLRVLRGTMPNLESVGLIVEVESFKHASFDFCSLGNLPLLQKVSVQICYTGDPGEEVEAAVRYAVDMHPNCPILHLRKSGNCEYQQFYFDYEEEHHNYNDHDVTKDDGQATEMAS